MLKKETNRIESTYATMANRRSLLLAIGYSVAIIAVGVIIAAILLNDGQGFVYLG